METGTTVNMTTWLVTQSALLFSAYGLGYAMPWWVVWFPSVFTIPAAILTGVVLAIVAMVFR